MKTGLKIFFAAYLVAMGWYTGSIVTDIAFRYLVYLM